MNQSTREIAAIIQKQYHIPAMAHLTCITATRGEVTELLYDLKADGVENVLALRGTGTRTIPQRRSSSTPTSWWPSSAGGGTSVCPPPVTLRAPGEPRRGKRPALPQAEGGRRRQHLVSQLFFDNEDFLRFLERPHRGTHGAHRGGHHACAEPQLH